MVKRTRKFVTPKLSSQTYHSLSADFVMCPVTFYDEKSKKFCYSKIWLHPNTPLKNSAPRLHSIEYTMAVRSHISAFPPPPPKKKKSYIDQMYQIKRLKSQRILEDIIFVDNPSLRNLEHLNTCTALKSTFSLLHWAVLIYGVSMVTDEISDQTLLWLEQRHVLIIYQEGCIFITLSIL